MRAGSPVRFAPRPWRGPAPSRGVWAAAWAVILGSAILAASLGSACSAGPLPRPYDGAALGPCEGQLAKAIPASQCKAHPGSGLASCTGSVAYALCNGTSFNVCTCELPGDYFTDGGTVDGGAGPPVKGAVRFDGGAHLPCCIGKTVFELPASQCPARCSGTTSYAVCVDQAYTECACDIPDGYGFGDFACPGDF